VSVRPAILPALAGRYAMERELGQGGMATVYLAPDPDVGRSTLVARSSAPPSAQSLSWTTDGWLHLLARGPGDQGMRLYRVRASGGAFEAEPPIGFESNASAGGGGAVNRAHRVIRPRPRVDTLKNETCIFEFQGVVCAHDRA